jgi:hypothetical protein
MDGELYTPQELPLSLRRRTEGRRARAGVPFCRDRHVEWFAARSFALDGVCHVRDAMELTLRGGDVVFIDTHDTHPDGGVFALHDDHGELCVMQPRLDGGSIEMNASSRTTALCRRIRLRSLAASSRGAA